MPQFNRDAIGKHPRIPAPDRWRAFLHHVVRVLRTLLAKGRTR